MMRPRDDETRRAVACAMYNQVLHVQLGETFAEHPGPRPTDVGIAQTLAKLGLRPACDDA